MLKALIPFAMLLISLFFASKTFALDIERIETYEADEDTQVRAIETVQGQIISIKEMKNGSESPLVLMTKHLIKTKDGKIIDTRDIEYFYAKKKELAGRAPKDDGGKGGVPFGRTPKDDE